MIDRIRPIPQPVLVPDPDARKDAAADEPEEGKPGADENAAGFLKNAIDKAADE